MLRYSILLLLLLEVLGCENVKSSDVAGTWTLTAESRQLLLPVQQKAAAQIVFNKDGSFIASEIPDEILYPPPEITAREKAFGFKDSIDLPPEGSPRLVTGTWPLEIRINGKWTSDIP